MKIKITQVLLFSMWLSVSIAIGQETTEKKNPHLGRIDKPREHCVYRSCTGEVVEESCVKSASGRKQCK